MLSKSRLNFLNPEELKELAKIKSSRPIVSLYLNVDHLPGKTWAEINAFCRQLGWELKKDHKKIFGQVLAKIENFVKAREREKNIKTLVFFADEEKIRRIFALPVGIVSRAVVENRAYVQPLSLLLDELPRYGVIAVDRVRARFFTMYLGVVEEQTDFFEDIVHKQIKTPRASWKGLAAKRMIRHIEEDLKFHLKNTAEKAARFFREKKIEKIVVGGHDDVIAKFLKVLPPEFKKRVIGSFRLQTTTDSLNVVKNKSLKVLEENERMEESALLKGLLRRSGPGAKAVLGLEKVLRALEEKRIVTLFIDGDWTATGYICPKDEALGLSPARCFFCGGEVESTNFFINKIIEKAIVSGAQVKHIFFKQPEFEKHHIGATLRY